MEEIVNKSELVTIRDGIESDFPFIYASWLRGYRHGNDHVALIDNDAYFREQHKTIESILSDPATSVKIACLKDQPDVILGYCVHKLVRMDWIFIKKSWRGIGLAKDLIPKDIKCVSHLTKVGFSLLRKQPNMRYNPYLT